MSFTCRRKSLKFIVASAGDFKEGYAEIAGLDIAGPGAVLRWSRGAVSLVVPQIQTLADRSDVISEVRKCSKIQIFRSFAPPPVSHRGTL